MRDFDEIPRPLSEGQELALAAELLEITSEAELEEYLAHLVSGVGTTVGGPIGAPIGRPLLVLLKDVAEKVFPMTVGDGLGTTVVPPPGTADRGDGVPEAGFFELELEGMDREQAELEVARRYVRFASAATARAARAPARVAPQQVVRAAATTAAQVHAPGLVRRPRRVPRRLVLAPVMASVGSGPPDIAWLQHALNEILGLRLAVDGILGASTRSAIRSFQSQQGLPVDGIAGPQTTQRLQALVGGGAGGPGRLTGCASVRQPCETLDGFALDSSAVLPSHQPALIRIAGCLISLGATAPPVRILGHTDASGAESYNAGLGRRRAETVADALRTTMDRMRPGSSRTVRLVVESLGESQPISGDAARNRRVDVCVPLQQPPIPPPTQPVVTDQMEIVVKSYIAVIGPRIGTTRCAVLPGEPTLQVFAGLTDAAYHERPTTPRKVKDYRLFSRCTFTVVHQGGKLLGVTPGPLETDVGFECPPGVSGPSVLCFTPPPMTRLRSGGARTGPSTFDFSWSEPDARTRSWRTASGPSATGHPDSSGTRSKDGSTAAAGHAGPCSH
jgi:outer membrane protein OmpA-like peptidoglycan-associated protein